MPADKDYACSLKRALSMNDASFQGKYLREAFDWLKNLVNDAALENTLPKNDADLKKFSEEAVDVVLNDKFRLKLIDSVWRSIKRASPSKPPKPSPADLVLNKDYTLSLNKGLFNEFQNIYVKDAFDEITDTIVDAEVLPETDAELAKFSAKTVDSAFDAKFRRRLVKQVMRSIKNAPPKETFNGY